MLYSYYFNERFKFMIFNKLKVVLILFSLTLLPYILTSCQKTQEVNNQEVVERVDEYEEYENIPEELQNSANQGVAE